MAGISSKVLKPNYAENKKKYNGIDWENDLELAVYDAYYRELDPQTGRWWQIDPEIENMEAWSPYASNYDNPITYSDPLGDDPDGDGGGDDPPKRSVWQGIKEGAINFGKAILTPPVVHLYNIGSAAAEGDFKPAVTLLAPGIGKVDAAVEFVKGDNQTRARVGTEFFLEVGGAFLGDKIIKVPEVKTPAAKTAEVKTGNYTNLNDGKSVGPGKDFTASQKKKIIEENKKRNGGIIKSDMSGTVANPAKQSKKGQKADMKQAEIDHKDPKSKGGSNSYSNAQVLTKEENLKKRDH
jgi:RHS repeat-associated protein